MCQGVQDADTWHRFREELLGGEGNVTGVAHGFGGGDRDSFDPPNVVHACKALAFSLAVSQNGGKGLCNCGGDAVCGSLPIEVRKAMGAAGSGACLQSCMPHI